jgi:hypothetical protein
MEYAARLPRLPSRRSVTTPVVALVVGAAAATGAYALIDNGEGVTSPSKVIVVETPAPGTADIAGKNEASTAAAISPQSGAEIQGKNESATAAAISQSSGVEIQGKNESATAAAISQSSGVDLRGSKASSTGTSGQDSAEAQRTDPHGPALSLRNP